MNEAIQPAKFRVEHRIKGGAFDIWTVDDEDGDYPTREAAREAYRRYVVQYPFLSFRIMWGQRDVTIGVDHPAPVGVGLPTTDAERKALPIYSFMFGYFPDAYLEVVRVAVKGNEQHNPGQPLHWAREKSTDQMNTAFRHLFDYGKGVKRDTDGVHHLAKAIWRLSAQLQLELEAAAKEEK